MKSPSEVIIQRNSSANVIVPASHPDQNACFQDALDHNKKSGASAINASHATLLLGNAKLSNHGQTSAAGNAKRQNAGRPSSTGPSDESAAGELAMGYLFRRAWPAIGALFIAAALTGCGRGPVEPPPPSLLAHTITFQLFVNGQINPSQANYIIAVNANTDPSTNVNPNEQPGEPTAQEAQGNPAPYTHWDQEFVFGASTQFQPAGFLYAYKVLSGGVGSTHANFLPIVLNTNSYTLITNGNAGTGTGNVLSMTLPIAQLSIRGNPVSSNPPTITSPPAKLLYVNYITTDTNGVPQHQLGAQGLGTVGFTLTVDLTKQATIPVPTFPNAPGPTNPNLYITGGQIIVNP